MALERKYCALGTELKVTDGTVISGYASLFDRKDQSGDTVAKGAYDGSLKQLASRGGKVKMLWQHDPAQPIGVWDEVREDRQGLWVKGRILTDVEKGREAATLISAGAIDGLSIGYRTLKATKDKAGGRRLNELDLWEVSLVTFPMLPEARVDGKCDATEETMLNDIATALEDARRLMAASRLQPN